MYYINMYTLGVHVQYGTVLHFYSLRVEYINTVLFLCSRTVQSRKWYFTDEI